MSKMLNLQTHLQTQLEKASGRAADTRVEPAMSLPKPVTQPPRAQPAYRAPSREGRVHIGAYLPADFRRSLLLVQAATGQNAQTILGEALNEMFRLHNVPVVDIE